MVERVSGLTLGVRRAEEWEDTDGDRRSIVMVIVALTGLVLAAASVRVLREYERGVVFRLGRVIDQKGPGLVLLIPAVDRMVG